MGTIEDSLGLSKNDMLLPSSNREYYPVESAKAFFHAIEWTEPFIIGLLMFHLCFATLIYVSKEHKWLEGGLFAVIGVLVFLCEKLNRWCSLHWRKLSTQNYFDEQGVFTCVMFATPILIGGFSILVRLLYRASKLVVEVKREEFRRLRLKNNHDSQVKTTQNDTQLTNKVKKQILPSTPNSRRSSFTKKRTTHD